MLKPYSPANEALEIAGLIKQPEKKQSQSEIRDVLNKYGASISDAAVALATALRNEDTALAAAKLTFQAHGVLDEDQAKPIPIINITIQGESKNLMNFITPTELEEVVH